MVELLLLTGTTVTVTVEVGEAVILTVLSLPAEEEGPADTPLASETGLFDTGGPGRSR